MNSNLRLSKTSFLKFEQCEKAFYFYKQHPYLRDKLSVDKQLTFKRGNDVGYFAQQLFPGGIDVTEGGKNSSETLALTEALIANKTAVIYEATFLFNGVLVMVDILHLEHGRYEAYEIKSSLKISETYLKDAYLQYFVLKHVLPDFEDLFLVTLNPDYVLEAQLEVKGLFRKRSVKLKAEENMAYFTHKIEQAHLVLEQNTIPNIGIGKHCFKPYTCDYMGTCWKNILTEDSIFNLPLVDRNTVFEWFDSGLRTMQQLSDEQLRKASWIKLRKAIVEGECFYDKTAIDQFLKKISLPLVAMDMELWSPAIPQLRGCKPFEQIPFLACFYDGEKYNQVFCPLQNDDRREFAEELIKLSKPYASILVYDKTMEVACLNKLIQLFPEFETDLQELKNKFADVFELFVSLNYYDPAFKTNFSLKAVSQVILKDLSYSKIASGLEAMNYFERYRMEENEIEQENLKNELINYCNTDSLATFGLYTFFQKKTQENTKI